MLLGGALPFSVDCPFYFLADFVLGGDGVTSRLISICNMYGNSMTRLATFEEFTRYNSKRP